jgi:hypothetical protein
MSAFTPGQQQLQSHTWLQGHTGDRPSFDAVIARGWSGPRQFQVFAMPQGLLCLDKGPPKTGPGSADQRAVMAGAVLGGALGAAIAMAVSSSMNSTEGRQDNYDMCSEEELLELARQRRKSFVAFYNDIINVSLTAPSFFGQIFGDRRTVGFVTVRERKLGTVSMEIRDASEMAVAIDSLPRRLGERVQIRVQLDPRTHTFVAR